MLKKNQAQMKQELKNSVTQLEKRESLTSKMDQIEDRASDLK